MKSKQHLPLFLRKTNEKGRVREVSVRNSKCSQKKKETLGNFEVRNRRHYIKVFKDKIGD